MYDVLIPTSIYATIICKAHTARDREISILK